MTPTSTAASSLLALLLPIALAAAEARSPGDLTVEERQQMMLAARDYSRCVQQEAVARVDAHDDIRRIADDALGACRPRLDGLAATITGWGFEAGFAEGYTATLRNRATRDLLPELAVMKSR